MKILLFGSTGQVGWQLRRSLAPLGDVVALHRGSQDLCGDLGNPAGLAQAVRAVRPDVVVNAAAYTAVDKAEEERDLAWAINARAAETLARVTADTGAWLVHYSTDYVYDGSGSQPWRETDPTGPLGIYGASKLAGDQAIQQHNPRHVLLRTSWVFDSWGQNFARSMLKLATSRDALSVVADQWGAPTRAALIADVTAHVTQAVAQEPSSAALAGLYHLAAAGETTWHAYAQLVLAEGARHGLALRVRAGDVKAITSSQYPTRARRPANSRLNTDKLRHTFGLHLPRWEDGVHAVVAELAQPALART